jgi:hypothetical protein
VNISADQGQQLELTDNVEPPKREEISTASALVTEALAIIDTSAIQIMSGGYIKFSGEGSQSMRAAEKLGEAHRLQLDDPWLHYAYAAALQLAAQYKTGREEMEKLAQAQPDFLLASFAIKGWDCWDGLFALPPWSPEIKSVHPAISSALKAGYVMGTRDGIHPRATLFLRCAGGDFANPQVLQNARIDMTTVVSDTHPLLAIVYARIWDNPQSPFRLETLGAPLYPRGFAQRCKYEYMCLQEDIDFTVIDQRNKILLNKRLPMPVRMKQAHSRLLRSLQEEAGYEISDAELVSAVRAFQSRFSPDDVRY